MNTSAQTFPYGLRDQLLSPTELAFYHTLVSVVQTHAIVCIKVRLADILFVARPHEHRAAFNRIAQKHIDFLLCESGSLRPLVGIELDDSSHQQPSRRERDDFVNQAFVAARLPLVHVPVQQTYVAARVAEQVMPWLGLHAPTDQRPVDLPVMAASPPVTAAAPFCTNCAVPMVVRTVAKGAHQGRRFYGCVNYPHCRVMRPLD